MSATPAYAYSTERLRTAYPAPSCGFGGHPTTLEQDIGTVNGAFDEAALLAFVGAGDGFVRTIYDQTGNLHICSRRHKRDSLESQHLA